MAQRNGGKGIGYLADEVRRHHYGKPDPTDWRDRYTPEQVAKFEPELVDIEAQLDAHYPAWRQRKPWTKETKEKVAWIKIRLKRRDLILHGQGEWGCYIHWNGDKPMAISVRPVRRGPVNTKAFGVLVSVPMLARNLGMTVAEVDVALAAMPLTERDARSWIPGHVAAARAASLPNPLPPPVSTGVVMSEGVVVDADGGV